MKIICAGFPKTGTKSMANALSHLGYNVHDFEEHLEYNLDNYLRFFDGDIGEEVFTEMYSDVDVVVDQPACTIWNILHQQFPEAKVILMERDSAEAWFKSYDGMFDHYRRHFFSYFFYLQPFLSRTHYKLREYCYCYWCQALYGKFPDKLNTYNIALSTATTPENILGKRICKV